jgi:NhaA family Na+:H+ antiporter
MRTRLTRHFIEFFESERSSGIALLSATILALLAANSLYGQEFLELWHIKLGFDLAEVHLQYDILQWINDGLMAVFFLLIGLEIEREIYDGELSDLKNAALPIFAAVGGMLTPALIYTAINQGLPTQKGFGIPMATDIAFALGALSLLGKRVPVSIKIFLAAFAIIDDLGAMLVIAFFYADGFSLIYLLLALAVYGFLLVLNRRSVNSIPAYLLPGLLMWYFMLQSGVHASIAGVLLAFALPFKDGGATSPSFRIEHFLNKPVAMVIMPIFALANSGILLNKELFGQIISANTLGIFGGLLIGKPLGIILFSVLTIKLGLARLPFDVGYKQLVGVGFLGGIGFTMSMFITILAFGETAIAQSSKIAIMLGSLVSGFIGILILSRDSFDTIRSFHDQNRHRIRTR